jgi:mitochondrial chaperone BCS1
MLLTWVSHQPFAQQASSILVRSGCRRGAYVVNRSDEMQKKALSYSPYSGSFLFWYKSHPLVFHSVKNDRYWDEEEVSITCLGRTPGILKDLFSTCRAEYLKLVEEKTCVFENHGSDWKRTCARSVRPLETVVTKEEVKDGLLNDIGKFLSPGSRKWHADRGFPYRRGYLLFGPPGTGKSSLSVAIAGYWELDIYVLNLSSVDDGRLATLFFDLPPRCVVLLEDVDAVSATKSREQGDGDQQSSTEDKSQGPVSLSGLLNVIDGVTSAEGRLLILTTNYIEKLDNALLRPGRVDQKIELGFADHEVLTKLFRIVFEPLNDDTDATQVKSGEDNLATDFASRVPGMEFSPAEIMSFLLENRQSPHMAMANVAEWITKTREQKEKIKRIGSWVLNA